MATESGIPFIGREKELAVVDENLQAWGTRRIIFLSGDGGVGKTRFLQEIGQRCAEFESRNIPLKAPSIFDFDDDRYKIPANIGFSLARELDVEAFAPYFEASRELRLAEERWGDPSHPYVRHRSFSVDRAFAQCFASCQEESDSS